MIYSNAALFYIRQTFLFTVLFTLFLSGCGKDPNSTAKPIPFVPYTIDSSKVIVLPSGVKIYPVLDGPGQLPKPSERICMHYYGMLPGGKKFDSSWDRGTPLCFNAFQGEVIKGLEEAIEKLRMGSKALIYIPGNLAYGEKDAPANIPPNSPLLFEVEILGNF